MKVPIGAQPLQEEERRGTSMSTSFGDTPNAYEPTSKSGWQHKKVKVPPLTWGQIKAMADQENVPDDVPVYFNSSFMNDQGTAEVVVRRRGGHDGPIVALVLREWRFKEGGIEERAAP